jgi:hypothetical protein
MKKRQFLSPLALSLAALLATNAANASLPQTPTTAEAVAPKVQENNSAQANDFVLKPAGSIQVADDDSPNHASHSSHSSHSSHYSSGY